MTLSMNDIQARKGQLIISPETFLWHHVLYTPGVRAPHASGVKSIFFSESTQHAEKTRPGSKLGVLTRPFHKIDAVAISNEDPNARLGHVIARGNAGYKENMRLDVHWVATTYYPTVPATPFPWYALTVPPALTVTQRLTGCAFVIRARDGVTKVAHIMPTAQESGQQLRARLVALLPADVTIYGRGDYSQDREATIVGVDSGYGWTFYAQKQDVQSFKIRSVKRIFP
jgi:hypothetical protein